LKIKLESVSFRIVLIGLVTILLCFAGWQIAWAGISNQGSDDYCNLCHTAGNATDGTTNQTCLECHSSSDAPTTYNLHADGQTVTVPVVNYLGSEEPTAYLAGGDFWWVSGGGTENDQKGHNVEGIAGEDGNWTTVPGQQIGGNDQLSISSCLGCHRPWLEDWPGVPFVKDRVGNVLICQDCHTPMHHADDSATLVDGTGGWFRFLYEVNGLEDSDWEETVNSGKHNEYQGETSSHANSISDKGCACHSQYHALRNPSNVGGNGSPWLMHPSDIILPSDADKEYRHYTVYNPQVPVARPDLSGYEGPSSTVTPGTDMVMCLSCHRAHGSPYPQMLRWDFGGCFNCHTNK
jgi:predicted CXXCH cytochrome family protein